MIGGLIRGKCTATGVLEVGWVRDFRGKGGGGGTAVAL